MATPEPVPAPFLVAVGLLGKLPASHTVVTAGHTRLPIEILSAEDGWLRCAQPAALAMDDALTVVIGGGERAAYEVDCAVGAVGPGSFVSLAVLGVRRVKPRRRYARRGVSESGLLRPSNGETEFDVQVVDIGPDGVAFVSARPWAVGDPVSGMLNIGRRAFPIRARVMHVQPLGFGRVRAGCQFTDLADANRILLDRLAKEAPVDRRGLRPIELLQGTAALTDGSPLASLEGLKCDSEAIALPTPRYCRQCSRVTLHRDMASPGSPPAWQCRNC